MDQNKMQIAEHVIITEQTIIFRHICPEVGLDCFLD